MSTEFGSAASPKTIELPTPMSPEILDKFVAHNKFDVNESNLRDRCVDGRYEKDHQAAIAKPGASAGDVVLVFGVVNRLQKSLPNEVVLETVLKACGGIKNFAFHTDQDAFDKGKGDGMGCGHIRDARLQTENYGVTLEQMEFLFSQLPKLLDQGATQLVLPGEHLETDVLIIDSENFSLSPNAMVDGQFQEAFIYQENLHKKQLDKLAKLVQEAYAEAGEVVEEQDVRLALDQTFAIQLGTTLKNLANGCPIYKVRSLDGEIEIQ